MNFFSLISVLITSSMLSSCKPMSESSTAASSSSVGVSAAACQLTEGQQKALLSSGEFSSFEKVDISGLSGEEREAVLTTKSSPACQAQETNQLAEVFPSVAAKLASPADTDSATALALGGDLSVGWPGVVRTGYIRVPSTGTRYLAGYNSAGELIQLLRLMQTRPR